VPLSLFQPSLIGKVTILQLKTLEDFSLMVDGQGVHSLRWIAPWGINALRVVDFYELDVSFKALNALMSGSDQKCRDPLGAHFAPERVRRNVHHVQTLSDFAAGCHVGVTPEPVHDCLLIHMTSVRQPRPHFPLRLSGAAAVRMGSILAPNMSRDCTEG
jgi:hypothetical protein